MAVSINIHARGEIKIHPDSMALCFWMNGFDNFALVPS